MRWQSVCELRERLYRMIVASRCEIRESYEAHGKCEERDDL